MRLKVDQRCPSCGTDVHRSVEIKRQMGRRPMQEFEVEWECPECACPFEQTAMMDVDQVEEFGFESWVGDYDGEPVCLVMEADVVDEEGKAHVGGH